MNMCHLVLITLSSCEQSSEYLCRSLHSVMVALQLHSISLWHEVMTLILSAHVTPHNICMILPLYKKGKKTYTILENLVWPNTRSKYVCACVTVPSHLKSRFQIKHRQLHCLFHECGGSWSCTLETASSIAEAVDYCFSFYQQKWEGCDW